MLKVLRYVILLCIVSFGLITGIGSGGGDQGGNGTRNSRNNIDTASTLPSGALTGQFHDSLVQGLEYKTATQHGITDLEGRFNYQEGETVIFSIGGIILGSSIAKTDMTLMALVEGAVDINDPKVMNICRFIQTLDDDGNLSNGILINESVRAEAADLSLNFNLSAAEFELDITVLDIVNDLTELTSAGQRTLIDNCDNCLQTYILEYDDVVKEVRRQCKYEGEEVPWATGYVADHYETQILTIKDGFEFSDTYIEQFQDELTELKINYLTNSSSEVLDFGWVLYSSTDTNAEMTYIHFKEPVVLWSSTADHIEVNVSADIMKYDTIGLFTPEASQKGMPEIQGENLVATFISNVLTRTETKIIFDYSLTITGHGTMRYCIPDDLLGFLMRKDKVASCDISISKTGTMTFTKKGLSPKWQLTADSYTETWQTGGTIGDLYINESVFSGSNMAYFLSSAVLYDRTPVDKEVFNVVDYGAISNCLTLNTDAINAAIDACSTAGGGIVYFPPGTYLSGSIHMKSNVTIKLDDSAVLRGTRNMTKYDPREENPNDIYQWGSSQSYFHRSLIWGENLTNVGFVGPGTIDGNDAFEPWGEIINRAPPPPLSWIISTLMWQSDPLAFQRGAKPISLKSCENVLIKDISIRHAPDESIFLADCIDVLIDRYRAQDVRVDGIDPVCCRNLTINHCEIKSLDDSIAIKSSYLLGFKCDSENITIKNSLLSHFINGLKIGTESVGDFRNIRYYNCIIHNSAILPSYAGISIISVDGGVIDNFSATNITMKNVGYPIFIRLGDRPDRSPESALGEIHDITISNIKATGAKNCSLILGLEEKPIGPEINLSNIDITYTGGGKKSDTYRDIIEISESDGVYPDPPYLLDGEPLAYGLYSRHVDGITLNNIKVEFNKNDYRAAFVCEDVTNLVFDNFKAEKASFSAPSIVCDTN